MKGLEEFFNGYEQYIGSRGSISDSNASSSESSNNNSNEFSEASLQSYFESLTSSKKQEVLANYFNQDGFDYVQQDSSTQDFVLEDETFYLERKGALPNEGETRDVKFVDSMDGSQITKKVRNNAGKHYIINENNTEYELTLYDENNNGWQFTLPGNALFFKALYKQFKQQQPTYDLHQAIAERNVDYLLKHHSDELQTLQPEILFTLNYNDENGHYGTLLHKAIDRSNGGMSEEGFLRLYNRIRSNPELWASYSVLTDNNNNTIADLAKEHKMELPEQKKADQAIDTHTQSVHKTVDQSIVRLAKQMDRMLGTNAIASNTPSVEANYKADPRDMSFQDGEGQRRFRQELDNKFTELKRHVDELASKSDDELVTYLSPSFEEFEKRDPKNSDTFKQLKRKLPKIKALLQDVEGNNGFGRQGNYPFDANHRIQGTNLSPKEILALSYYASQDENNLIGFSTAADENARNKLKLGAELSFFKGVYDARRGYNIDDEKDNDPNTRDENRCMGGSINSIIKEGLYSINKLVEVSVVDKATVMQEARNMITKTLENKDLRGTLELENPQLQLMVWSQNNAMPSKLQNAFNSVFQENIVSNLVQEYGSYFSAEADKQLAAITQLYGEAIKSLKPTKDLIDQVGSLDMNTLSQEQIYDLVTKKELPNFVLSSDRGYTSPLDYISVINQDKFSWMINEAAKRDKLLELVDNNLTAGLSALSPLARKQFIDEFQQTKGLEYRDKNGDGIIAACIKIRDNDMALGLLAKTAADAVVLNNNNETAANIAIRCGNTKLVAKLIEFYPNIKNKFDSEDLIDAAEEGRADVIELLAGCPKVNPDHKNRDGDTALYWAAAKGHIKTVKALLDGFPEVSLDISCGRHTPLMIAYYKGHANVVDALLDAYKKKPGSPITDDIRAAAKLAIRNNDLTIAKIFKERYPDENLFDSEALIWAANEDRTDVIELLAGCPKVNPDYQNQYGDTALHLAAAKGHTKVVESLLRCFPNIRLDISNVHRHTPLMIAINDGQDNVVDALLGAYKKKPGSPIDSEALLWAAKEGRADVIELLKDYQGIDCDYRNQRGDTALHLATAKGHTKVVEALLDGFPDIRLDIQNGFASTPLENAIINGHANVVDALLDAYKKKPGSPITDDIRAAAKVAIKENDLTIAKIFKERYPDENLFDSEALIWAAKEGRADVIELLKDCQGIDCDYQNQKGDSALHLAAVNGHIKVVKALLDGFPDIRLDIKNRFACTTLMFAANTGRYANNIADALLDAYKKKPGSPITDDIRAAAKLAIRNNDLTIAKIFKERYPDENLFDSEALIWAAKEGRADVIELLKGYKGIDCNAQDKNKNTILDLAAGYRGGGIVERLISAFPNVEFNCNMINDRGRTPLMTAIYSGSLSNVEQMVKHLNIDFKIRQERTGNTVAMMAASLPWGSAALEILIKASPCDLNMRNSDGKTILMIAEQNNSDESVSKLLKSYQDNQMKWLIDKGADNARLEAEIPNLQTPEQLKKAMIAAVDNENIELVVKIIKPDLGNEREDVSDLNNRKLYDKLLNLLSTSEGRISIADRFDITQKIKQAYDTSLIASIDKQKLGDAYNRSELLNDAYTKQRQEFINDRPSRYRLATFLQEAVLNQDMQLLQKLCQKANDLTVNDKDSQKDKPLFEAAQKIAKYVLALSDQPALTSDLKMVKWLDKALGNAVLNDQMRAEVETKLAQQAEAERTASSSSQTLSKSVAEQIAKRGEVLRAQGGGAPAGSSGYGSLINTNNQRGSAGSSNQRNR